MPQTKRKTTPKGPHPHHVPLGMALLIAMVFVLTGALIYVWKIFPHTPAYVPPKIATSTIPVVPAIPDATSTPATPAPDCGNHGHWNGTDCLCGGIAGWSCPADQECGDLKPTPTTPDALGTCHAKPVATSTEMLSHPPLPPELTVTTSTVVRPVKIFLLKGYYGEDFQPASCGDGKFFTVNVPKTTTPIKTSVTALLYWSDLSDGEGYTSNIPEGTQLLSATLSNGVLKLEFSKELENYGGGSCNVESIRTQIEKTAMQFGNVNKVEITVPGKTPEETLQP
jgi:hypothetical protein